MLIQPPQPSDLSIKGLKERVSGYQVGPAKYRTLCFLVSQPSIKSFGASPIPSTQTWDLIKTHTRSLYFSFSSVLLVSSSSSSFFFFSLSATTFGSEPGQSQFSLIGATVPRSKLPSMAWTRATFVEKIEDSRCQSEL